MLRRPEFLDGFQEKDFIYLVSLFFLGKGFLNRVRERVYGVCDQLLDWLAVR